MLIITNLSMVLILLFKVIHLKSLLPIWTLISIYELNAMTGRDRPIVYEMTYLICALSTYFSGNNYDSLIFK